MAGNRVFAYDYEIEGTHTNGTDVGKGLPFYNQTYSPYSFADDGQVIAFFKQGEIKAKGDIKDLSKALSESLLLALALGTRYRSWKPKMREMSFQSKVHHKFREIFGQKNVQRRIVGTGASGHDIQFSFGIKREDNRISFVEIATVNDHHVNWNDQEYGRAVELLSDVSHVARFDETHLDPIFKVINM